MIDKVAVKPIKQRIHGVPVGGTLLVTRRQARLLVALQRAEYFQLPAAEPAEPATEPDGPRISARTGKPIRQYRRRDMRAED